MKRQPLKSRPIQIRILLIFSLLKSLNKIKPRKCPIENLLPFFCTFLECLEGLNYSGGTFSNISRYWDKQTFFIQIQISGKIEQNTQGYMLPAFVTFLITAENQVQLLHILKITEWVKKLNLKCIHYFPLKIILI